MSDERLILPVKPHHHRHRFLAAVLGCSALVAVVWGFQMKTTFKKFAVAREAQVDKVSAQSASQAQFLDAADTLKAQISVWQAQLQQEADKEAAKQELLDKVTDGMKASLDAQSSGAAPAPVVAGDTAEVPAP